MSEQLVPAANQAMASQIARRQLVEKLEEAIANVIDIMDSDAYTDADIDDIYQQVLTLHDRVLNLN